MSAHADLYNFLDTCSFNVLYFLYSNGADIHHVDPAGQSAFHWAMKTPNIECLKLLCKYINSPVMVNQPVSLGPMELIRYHKL